MDELKETQSDYKRCGSCVLGFFVVISLIPTEKVISHFKQRLWREAERVHVREFSDIHFII